MQALWKHAIAVIIGVVLVLLLAPKAVVSQTASPTNIAMVKGKLAEAGAPENSTGAAAKDDVYVPTLKEILTRADKAMGGSEAWKNTNTIMMKGVLQTEDSSAFVAIEIYKKSPDKSLMKMKLPQDLEMREVCDGKSAWSEDPRGGYHEYKGAELESRLRRSQFSEQSQMIFMAATGKVLDVEKIGLNTVYVVEYSPMKNQTTRLYFDAETGLLVRSAENYDHPELAVKLDMDDYRSVDGMMFPFRMKRTEKGSVIKIRLTQVKGNLPIDDEMFVKPTGASKQ